MLLDNEYIKIFSLVASYCVKLPTSCAVSLEFDHLQFVLLFEACCILVEGMRYTNWTSSVKMLNTGLSDRKLADFLHRQKTNATLIRRRLKSNVVNEPSVERGQLSVFHLKLGLLYVIIVFVNSSGTLVQSACLEN